MKRHIKRLAGVTADWFARVAYDPFFPKEKLDSQLVTEIRSDFETMNRDDVLPDARIDDTWTQFRRRLRSQFTLTPANFLRVNPAGELLGLSNARSALGAWKAIKGSGDWPRYSRVLSEDATGRPVRFVLRPSSSGSQIHHTSHICHFEKATGKSIDSMKLIVEFGGGYGSFCRQVHRLGFSGKYIIYDLPELSALQRYWLRAIGLNVLPREKWADPNAAGIVLMTQMADLDRVVNALRPAAAPALFVATWSLSEVPRVLREETLAIVGGFDHMLIAYQENFGDVGNSNFFGDMVKSPIEAGGGGKWHHLPVPGNISSHYVIR